VTTTVRRWTGLEAKALRAALRMTMHEFAGYLGVAARTVAKWEARGSDIQPMSQTQAILDTALAKASSDVQARFGATVSDCSPLGRPLSMPSLIPANGGLRQMSQRSHQRQFLRAAYCCQSWSTVVKSCCRWTRPLSPVEAWRWR
jgi:transcriptional regulator with XRE-family HTH domain